MTCGQNSIVLEFPTPEHVATSTLAPYTGGHHKGGKGKTGKTAVGAAVGAAVWDCRWCCGWRRRRCRGRRYSRRYSRCYSWRYSRRRRCCCGRCGCRGCRWCCGRRDSRRSVTEATLKRTFVANSRKIRVAAFNEIVNSPSLRFAILIVRA